MTDDEQTTAPTGPAGVHPATLAERTAKGTSADIIAGQAEATAAKTVRLRGAREARDAAQAAVDTEAMRTAPSKKIAKKRTPRA